MNIDELWFILINISNEQKIILMNKYKNESNIRKNKNNIKFFGKNNLDEISDEKIISFANYIKNNGIGYITISSKEYPKDLHEYKNMKPYVIFYKGNLELLNGKLVSIIGSRKCTAYGAEVSKKLGEEISKVIAL